MRLAGFITIFALSCGVLPAFAEYVAPSQQEQDLYNSLRSEFEKITIPKKDVSDTMSSFTTPITFYFPCNTGDLYNSVDATIQTRLAKFDSSIGHSGGAITGGIYTWKCSITVSGGKMTINCNNELMLNEPALMQSTEKDPTVKQIENLVVFYHELLHGQLMIDAMKSSDSWHDHTCKTNIQQDLDYSYSDADHQVITPLQTEFAKKLIEDQGGFFNVQEISPDQTSAGSFSKKVGSLYDYPQYVKSGISISARSYNIADIKVSSQKNDIMISGTLNDKTKTGIVWLYIFGKESTDSSSTKPPTTTTAPKPISIPDWVKDLAKWWSNGTINDSEFVSGIKYMIEHDIISIPQTTAGQENPQPIPYWIKNNAKWWSQGAISDADFASGLQYLIQHGIMQIQVESEDSGQPTMTATPPDEPPESTQSMGSVQISPDSFAKQSHQSAQGQIAGKVNDFKTGTYVILTVIKPDGTNYDLKAMLTNKGQFTIPIMIDSNWQVGKYTILAKYNNFQIGSDSFLVQ